MTESRSPSQADSGQVFRGVGMPGAPGEAFDLVVECGRVARFEGRSRRIPHWLLLPPLVDLHVHANRAFTLGAEVPSSFEHAVAMAHELFRSCREPDYARLAERFFAQALSKGTTRVRTHADVAPDAPFDAVLGTLAARERVRGKLDVEVVAFAAAASDPADARARAALSEACRLGAGLLGAVPALYADPRASIDALLDLAIELQVPVDVHLDEHLDAARSCSEYLAQATLARGLQGRVTLSHGCAIAALEPDARKRVAETLARARITLVVLPTTNLYLQDRGGGTPLLRGLTAVKDLAAAGVELRFASDNVRDGFFPYGGADLLDIAHLTAMAAQVDDAGLLLAGICDGVRTVNVGAEASFVLVRGSSLNEVLGERPADRVVVRRGRVLERAQPPQ